MIVCDYFHWPQQGDWKFDKAYWPDPAAMVKELTEMGIHLLVSIWPTVDPRSENYFEMREQNMLIRAERDGSTGILQGSGDLLTILQIHPHASSYGRSERTVEGSYFGY